MATAYQNQTRSFKYPTVPKSRVKKPISQQHPSTIKNKFNDIKIRYYFSFINIYK